MQYVADTRTSPPAAALHVPERRRPTRRRRAAPTGSATRSFTQYFGLPDLEYNTVQYGFFVQDDWRVSPDLKVLYGVRYDLYDVPDADPERAGRDLARLPDRQEQLRAARRRGLVARRRPRGRCSAPTPASCTTRRCNAIYEQALQNDGTNARASATLHADAGRRAGVPGRAAAPAPARSPNTAWTVDPGLRGRAHVAEQRPVRARARRSLLGRGRRVLREGLQPAGRHQHQPDQPDRHARRRPADLQHRRSTPRRASIRATTSINIVAVDRRVDLQEPDAAVHAAQRRRHRQFDFAYTLGKSEDNAPITSALSVQGDAGRVGPDQPRSRPRSEHPRPAPHLHRQHRRHAAVRRATARRGAIAQRQRVRPRAAVRQRHPGQPAQQPPRSTTTASASDRPVGVPRNSLNLPARYNVDFRYSRQIPIGGTHSGRGDRRGQEPVQHRAGSRRRTPRSPTNAPACRWTRCRPAATS